MEEKRAVDNRDSHPPWRGNLSSSLPLLFHPHVFILFFSSYPNPISQSSSLTLITLLALFFPFSLSSNILLNQQPITIHHKQMTISQEFSSHEAMSSVLLSGYYNLFMSHNPRISPWNLPAAFSLQARILTIFNDTLAGLTRETQSWRS